MSDLSRQPLWSVQLLGRLEVTAPDGSPAKFGSRTALALFAYLCLQPNREFSTQELHSLFWPESDGDKQAQNLRRAIAVLRKVLEQDVRSGSIVITRRGRVFLNRDRLEIDVQRFQEICRRCGTASDEDLREAVRLYEGALLPLLADAWVIPHRVELEQRFCQVIELLCGASIKRGRAAEAVETSRIGVRLAPTREEAHITAIQAFAVAGMAVEALRQFEELERVLDETWGEIPSEAAREALEGAFKDRYAGKHNLPAQVTSFIGRERAIEEAIGHLRQTRLLTLTGSGGCGKTRLALQVAERMLSEYVDGVWFVELAALADPELVAQTVAGALGVPDKVGEPIGTVLLEWLKPKRLLLVVDNCEHLLLSCARVVGDVLKHCPRVQVLASSREGLAIGGEVSYRVPSLSMPDPKSQLIVEELMGFESVRLFVARAKAIRPDFVLRPQHADAMKSVCTRLDGIPLAIELAAARMRAISLAELNDGLDDRFRLLTGGARTALPRQQTLRSLIDWSYDLLTEPEKSLFRRLAAFAGGWTLEAANDVCSGGTVESDGVLDLLTSLCDKSLVVAESGELGTRYRMLETIRQYARDRLLESGEGRSVRDRHMNHFLAVVERTEPHLRGPEQKVLLDELEREHDNFRSALEWASTSPEGDETGLRLSGALGHYVGMRGYYREGLSWILEFMERAGEREPTPAWRRAIRQAGILASYIGELDLSQELRSRHLELERRTGDPRGIALALKGAAASEYDRGNMLQARALLEESLSILLRLDGPDGGAGVRGNLGIVALEIGEPETARQLLEAAIQSSRLNGDLYAIANFTGWLAKAYAEFEEFAASLSLSKESILQLVELGERDGIGDGLRSMAYVVCRLGDPHRAAMLWGAGEQIHLDAGIGLRLSRIRQRYERQLAEGKAAMGDDVAFDRAWADGRTLTTAQAVELAISAFEGSSD